MIDARDNYKDFLTVILFIITRHQFISDLGSNFLQLQPDLSIVNLLNGTILNGNAEEVFFVTIQDQVTIYYKIGF